MLPMLLLLRNAAKEREFALRRALGANARVLFGYLISESLLLVTAGCMLAWLLAGPATEALTRWSGLDIVIEPDRRVLLFTIAISAVVALAFGLVPMRFVSRLPLAVALKSSASTFEYRPAAVLEPQTCRGVADLPVCRFAFRGRVALRNAAQSGIEQFGHAHNRRAGVWTRAAIRTFTPRPRLSGSISGY